MKFRHRSKVLLLIAVLLATPLVAVDNSYDRANSEGVQFILKASPAQLDHLAAQYGLTVKGELHANSRHLYVVEGPAGMTAEQISDLIGNDNRVLGLSTVALTALHRNDDSSSLVASESDAYDDLHRSGTISAPCLSTFVSQEIWSGYGDQRLINQINLHQAHEMTATLGCGGATVAVIDTGVDPNHPILRDALVPGYDFRSNEAGIASEWTNLDQSIMALTEQSIMALTEQSIMALTEGEAQMIVLDEMISPILDQSIMALTEGLSLPPSFGHGTMVAGLVRLVAPGARIMPLKVFGGDGQAHLFDILRAIYFAVDNGADIINMSFSMTELDHELIEAIRYAHTNGVVVVAAAGNQAQQEHVYPAALSHTLGVASVNLDDTLSGFSNFGSGMVSLAAPGAAVISTYPGGLYAAGWGTSFSSPLVTGAAALVHRRPVDRNNGANSVNKTRNDLLQGSDNLSGLTGLIGSGRLDVEATLWNAGQ